MALVGVEAVAPVGVGVRRGDASVFCVVFVLSRVVCVFACVCAVWPPPKPYWKTWR